MVILGYRYSGYTLADVRIHDINLVADLNAHDPMAPEPPQGEEYNPVEYDGTQLPRSGTLNTALDSFETDAEDYLSCYWTGWWPTLHFVVDFQPLPGVDFNIGLHIDILGMWGVDWFDFQLIDESTMSDSEMEALGQTTSDEFAPFFLDISALAIGLNVAYWAARLLSSLAEKGNPVALAIFGISVISFLVLWHMWILEFCHMIIESAISPIAAGYMLVSFAVSVLLVCGSTFAASGRLPSVIYRVFDITDNVPQDFTLSSYAIFAMSLLMMIQIVALAAALIYTSLLDDMANDFGSTVAT